MKLIAILMCAALAGCMTIPNDAATTLANAGGGCVKTQGLWGSIIMMVGGAEKGSIRNGEVQVSGDCGGITIKDAASVRAVPPVPGTVTTIVVPGSTTTTVAPGRP